ncbi:MAG: ACP S-malonyltransferase [Chloroflexota bacterium]
MTEQFPPPPQSAGDAEHVAFVFPGQSSQFVGMGREIYESSPSARLVFEQADDVLGFSLSRLCFEGPAAELDDTINTQPAILTVSVAYLEALREKARDLGQRVRPLYVAGHSLGEYTALVAANVLDFGDALRLVRERGRLMKESGESRPGGMAAIIGLDLATLEEVCRSAAAKGVITLANQNTPLQTIISGELAALSHAMDLARERGAQKVIRLKVSIASHSPLMSKVAQGLSDLVATMHLRDPEVPFVANIGGQVLHSAAEIRRELAEQVCRPVEWTRSVVEMIDGGGRTFVKTGPGQVLSGLIRHIRGEVQAVSFKDLPLTGLFGGQTGGTPTAEGSL